MDKAHGEPRVAVGLGEDVGNAVAVAEDVNALLEAGHKDRSFSLRQ